MNVKTIKRVSAFFCDVSIKYKFYILFVFIVLMMGTFMILSNYLSTNAIIKKAAGQSYREAVLIAGLLDGYFGDAVSYAQLLTIDGRFQENLVGYAADTSVVNRTKVRADVMQIVNTYMIARPIFSDISITDDKFSMVYSGNIHSPKPEEVVESISQDGSDAPILPEFTKLMTLSGRTGNQPGIALVKSVIEKERGKRIGIIVLYMSEDDIEKTYSARGYYNGEITIVDAGYHVLSSTRKENLFERLDIEKAYGFKADGSYFVKDGDGQEVIVSAATMSGTGWKIINKVHLSEVTKELATTSNMFLIITIIGLMLAIISNYIISASVLTPILKLSGIMESFRLSQTFDLRVETNSNDEVGKLGKVFNNMMSQIKALMVEKNLQQRFIREYEVRLLQAQINPHFLYNSLETIIMLEQLDLKEQSIDAAKKLASFYRLTLNHGYDYITVRDEINLTSSYLSIQKYRYIEYVDYKIDIQPEIMHYIMPKLTIQPILENAIYHGLKPKNGGCIELKGFSEGQDILFVIRDNGMGMEQEKINKLLSGEGVHDVVGSFGIPSVDTKLKLLYGKAYGLTIMSEVGRYTEVVVKIPMTLTTPEIGGSL